MNRRFFFGGICSLLFALPLYAVNDIREFFKSSDNYKAGPSAVYYFGDTINTPAPKGYKPFHIELMSRHGSRTHHSGKPVINLWKTLSRADSMGILTPEGKRLKNRMDTIYNLMNHRWGDLTPLGSEQHRGIASRMYHRFPDVFSNENGPVRLEAQSTVVPRSMGSMGAFVTELKGLVPSADFFMDPSHSHDNALRCFESQEYDEYMKNVYWKKQMDSFTERHVPYERLMKELFAGDYRKLIANPRTFVTDLYSLAIILPNTDYGLSLYEWFTEDETYEIWSTINFSQYIRKGNSAPGKGLPVAIARPILQDMLNTAQNAVEGKGATANLRFAHGENTIPLAAMLGIKNAAVTEPDPEKVAEVWQDFTYNPMAANIQWILYKNKDGKVLVKVLFNEEEVKLPIGAEKGPYYDWDAFRSYCEKEMAAYPSISPVL